MISVTVFGNVGSDPEMRASQSGTPILGFSVASNEGRGEHKVTTWARISVFGKQAENLATLVRKGARVLVTGSAKLREWTGRDGAKRVDLEVDARDVQVIDYPERDAQAAPAPQRQAAAPVVQYHPPGTSPGAGATHRLEGGAWVPLAPPAPPAPPPPPANGYAPPPPPPGVADVPF